MLRVNAFDGVGEYVLGLLDILGIVVEVILCVQVKIGDVVAHFYQVVRTGSVTGGVRRAHICRNDTKNIAEGHFVVVHLIVEFRGGKTAKILVRPSVASNLVTRIVHPLYETSEKGLLPWQITYLDKLRIACTAVVDFSFPKIVAGCFESAWYG